MKLSRAEKIIAAGDRDAIIGINSNYALGGIERFTGLDIGRLDALISLGHADPAERHNLAPSIWAFRDFLAAHPRFTAHGYTVSPDRPDYRMSLEGVELLGEPTDIELIAFNKNFIDADDKIVSHSRLYCWYD